MFNKETSIIYLDMDGVLADFDAFVLENMGRTFDHTNGPSDREMWNFLMSVDRMYFNLKPTPYFLLLVETAREICDNVQILTAIPRRATMPDAEQDKIEWAKKYIPGEIKVNIGPFSRDKKNWARPGDVLLDDRVDNIEAWRAAGGIGILHKYDDHLESLVELWNLV